MHRQLNFRGRVNDVGFHLIQEWHSQKQPIAEIARRLGIARSTVRSHIQSDTPPSQRAKPQPPGVSPAKIAEMSRRRQIVKHAASAKQVIKRHAKRSTRVYVRKLYPSTNAISRYLRTHGYNVSPSTVRRDLIVMGVRARRRRTVPYLNPHMKAERVRQCRDMLNGNTLRFDKNKLLFSDEKRFDSDDHSHVFDWVAEGVPTLPRQHDTNSSKIMVWGVIGVNYRHLVVLKAGSIDAARYQSECLQPAIGALRAPGVIFMQDNARPHSSESTRRYLKRRHVVTLQWPPYSPDLNPIENLWAYLTQRVSAAAPFGTEALAAAIVQEWNMIPQAYIDALVVF
ncbi:MAG: transposase [Solirubrobacteraceae bacterium]|nr:transposase [Solirubrobacteraceae bacterium]